MKREVEIKGTDSVGVNVKLAKSLNKLSGKILFPEKLKATNKIIGSLK